MANSLPGLDATLAVENVAHLVQVALTPVFLLSGIGTLLNVFNTRLSRVSDHAEQAADLWRKETDPASRHRLDQHLIRLQPRRVVLDVTVVLGAMGGTATCGAAFVLFL